MTFQKCCWDHRKHSLLNSFAQHLPFFSLHRGLQHQILLCVCARQVLTTRLQTPVYKVIEDSFLATQSINENVEVPGFFFLNISKHPNQYHFFSPTVYHSSLCKRKYGTCFCADLFLCHRLGSSGTSDPQLRICQ